MCAFYTDTYNSICGVALGSSCVDLKCADKLASQSRSSTECKLLVLLTRLLRCKSVYLVHFGRVASVNVIIRSGHHQDDIAAREQVIAVETEAAGIWNALPAVGICDTTNG